MMIQKTSLFSYPMFYLITIDDPQNLPGKSIYNLIIILLKIVNFKYVFLNDINGALISELEELEGEVIEINKLLNVICGVKQFDWGDFFLFKEYPKNWNPKERIINYPIFIAKADTTIRAVDDQYMYIYTKDESIVNAIRKNYEIESIKLDKVENLEYPY